MFVKYLDVENQRDTEKWDCFVDSSPQGNIFCKSWYLDAISVNYKLLTITDDQGDILGGIVLTKNEINTFSNPMLVKYLGVLLKFNYDLSHKRTSKFYKILDLLTLELRKYKSFDYYFHPNFQNWIPFYWKDFNQQTRYTYRINLQDDISHIKNAFHSNLKNDIRNALNRSITIINDVESADFYNVINKTFLRQGSKSPFNKEKLDSFIVSLKKRNKFISFGAINSDGEVISVCGIIYDDKSSYLILNGIDIDKQIRGANALMLFESIKYFNNNCTYYDFEGSMLLGVEQFYRRFGGELTPYFRIWNDNLFNYAKSRAKKIYKKIRYGR